jgi:hypothetical protein
MRNLALLASLLLTSTALADELDLDDAPVATTTTPWYLPRDLYLGAFFNGPQTLQFRASWEFVFAPERIDALELVLDAGGGWAMGVPNRPDADGNPALSSFFEHTVQAGLGYRRLRKQGFYWGAQITVGPEWYGATGVGLGPDNKPLGVEHYTVGVVEGRAQLGWWVGKAAVGLSIGLQQAMAHPPPSFSYNYVGGFGAGMFVHWL